MKVTISLANQFASLGHANMEPENSFCRKWIGGIPTDSVTAKTDILVVGQQDYRVVGDSGMSSKQKKAITLLEKGQDIEILSEIEFLSRI